MYGEPPIQHGSPVIYDRLRKLEEENRGLHTELLRSEESRAELYRLLNQNPQTGLPIRRLFDRDLAGILKDTRAPIGIAIVRLDKAYDRIRNSRDRSRVLLFKTALRIQGLIGESVYQSDRLDEFFLIIHETRSPVELSALARSVVQAVSEPHEPPASDITFGCHIGLAWAEQSSESVHEFVGNAYIALNEAEIRNVTHLLYTPDLGEAFRRSELLEKELRRAIQNGFTEFSMVYQPFVDRAGLITGAEALIRWNSATVGSIGPQRFIPLAEETGDIRLIGQWTLYNACRQLVRWRTKAGHPLHISVNLSSSQFKERDLVDRIEGVLKALRLGGDSVKLELTETAIMQDPDTAIQVMERLRRQGIRISIDDFGTGYSSLSYLKQFPVQTVKIDKSFVEGLPHNVNNQEIIKAIVAMAKNLHMETLAEGVETAEELDFLIREGCDHVQGYYFSPPVDPQTFAGFLANGALLTGGRTASAIHGAPGTATVTEPAESSKGE
ncbi:MAG: putative bifunctional diguanylate cyclase/phosphodiesterase [Spirochaetota bacterium]